MPDFPEFIDFDPENDEIIAHEVVEHEKASTDRSLARRVSLQSLYEIDSSHHPVERVLAMHLANDPEMRRVRLYVSHLVRGIATIRRELDRVLQQYAPEWPFDQVAIVDRNILRIALFEMCIDDRTPVGVAIDEAVELAKLFGAEGTPRFVNGVLGAIAANLETVRATLAPFIQKVQAETPPAPSE